MRCTLVPNDVHRINFKIFASFDIYLCERCDILPLCYIQMQIQLCSGCCSSRLIFRLSNAQRAFSSVAWFSTVDKTTKQSIITITIFTCTLKMRCLNKMMANNDYGRRWWRWVKRYFWWCPRININDIHKMFDIRTAMNMKNTTLKCW